MSEYVPEPNLPWNIRLGLQTLKSRILSSKEPSGILDYEARMSIRAELLFELAAEEFR